MIEINRFVHDKMRALGEEVYKKFLAGEVIRLWNDLVDKSIAAQIKPVKIEHGVLFVCSQNSAFKDQLKFLTEEIIDTINGNFRQEIVKKIRLARAFQIAEMPPEIKMPAQIEEPQLKPEDITLTDEEIAHCKELSESFSNVRLRGIFFETLLIQARGRKFRLAKGWHKCKKCESLCPPEESFCEVCLMQERETMNKALFKIFYDEPWLKAWEARKILLEQMPHMAKECSMAAVESARTTLIQRVASRVRFGDEKSPDALRLVMLAKRLPEEKLTPVIIKRTLSELQFNLSDGGKFPRQR